MIKINPYNFNAKSYKNSRTNKCVSAPNVSFTSAQKLLPNGIYPKRFIKLLVLDIDGTISDRVSNSVVNELKNAVAEVKKKGIMVILNTGREFKDAQKIAKELNLDTPIICNYGKYIKEDAKTLYENPKDDTNLKGDTLEHFAGQLGIQKEHIMSIGNDVEDISMFKKSGTSVLIENSMDFDDIEPHANYTADYNANSSGVVLAINKLIL